MFTTNTFKGPNDKRWRIESTQVVNQQEFQQYVRWFVVLIQLRIVNVFN
jgi:hypothetical protein